MLTRANIQGAYLRLMERYPSIAKYYDINYVADEKGVAAVDIICERKPRGKNYPYSLDVM